MSFIKKRGGMAAGSIFCAALLLLSFWNPAPRTVDEVMADFHRAENRCEGTLQDPLILNADLVRTRVIEDIKNPAMDKRRYAIGFLGNDRAREALPTLRAILGDESEKDYFRSDALQSIFLIDSCEGRELAPAYAGMEGILGWTAREILAGGESFPRRSYLDALIGWH